MNTTNKIQQMFYIEDSNVVFQDCKFLDNTQNNKRLFTIATNSNVSITDCAFNGNLNIESNTELFYIESIQVKSSKDNKTVYKKNTSVPQDPIDPSITKIYKCIIELDLSINS